MLATGQVDLDSTSSLVPFLQGTNIYVQWGGKEDSGQSIGLGLMRPGFRVQI